MSDPTYRIDVEHRPQELGMQWIAKVTRLGDDAQIAARWADTPDEAMRAGQECVAEVNRQQPGFTLYVDDDGRPVEGHSVKA